MSIAGRSIDIAASAETDAPPIGRFRRAVRLAWDALSGIARDFIWQSLRDGVIRLRGLPPGVATVVVLASSLIVLTALSFGAGDLLRQGRALIVIPEGAPGRGTLVPTALVPLTFALVSIGAALLLAGALHAAIAVRLVVVTVYTSVAVFLVGMASRLEFTSGVPVWPAWILVAAVPTLAAVRWRARPRPGAEFAILLALVAGTIAIAANALLRSDHYSGTGLAVGQLALLLTELVVLSTPLLIVAGLDIVGFGVDAATWVVRFANRRLSHRLVWAGFAALAAWRCRDVGAQVLGGVRSAGAVETLLPLLGVGLLMAALWGYWMLLRRVGGRAAGAGVGDDSIDHGSGRLRLALGIAYGGLGVVIVVIGLALQGAISFLDSPQAIVGPLSAVSSFVHQYSVDVAYHVAVGLALALAGVVLARRGRGTMALFVGLIGVSDLVTVLLANIGALDGLHWEGHGPVDAMWTAAFVVAGVWWVGRRELTANRAERLLLLLLLGALLSQFGFISDPFAPLLAFAGAGFLVFGILWGFLTGGSWANEDSIRFPRSSRLYLYLGYSLFSIAVLNWFAVAHDADQLAWMERMGSRGVGVLGYPLLYALFTVILVGAITERPLDELEDADEESTMTAVETVA